VQNAWFRPVLAVHIALGTVALLFAPLAMITVKRGLWHRRWGKIYFWAMAGVALTAAILCWLHAGLFLFLIAVFSFYMALSGYRALGRKQPNSKPAPFDFAIAVALALSGGGLVGNGLAIGEAAERGVRIIFGMLGLWLGLSDVRLFLKYAPSPHGWMLSHMTRFVGAYIATVTAFSVVNFQFLPYAWRWLWPTMFGTLGIIAWRRHYAKKFKIEFYGNVQ
jgi:hypothetical protein